MENNDPEFLPVMVGILQRLQLGSAERGYSMLAAFLDMARDEVAHLLAHEAALADLKAKLAATSSRHSWRPGDFPSLPEDAYAAEETYAAEAMDEPAAVAA
jgi:hypothetical protein